MRWHYMLGTSPVQKDRTSYCTTAVDLWATAASLIPWNSASSRDNPANSVCATTELSGAVGPGYERRHSSLGTIARRAVLAHFSENWEGLSSSVLCKHPVWHDQTCQVPMFASLGTADGSCAPDQIRHAKHLEKALAIFTIRRFTSHLYRSLLRSRSGAPAARHWAPHEFSRPGLPAGCAGDDLYRNWTAWRETAVSAG